MRAVESRVNAKLLLICCGALLTRGLALWLDRDSLLFDAGGIDAPQYVAMARGFWSGEWPGAKPFFWAPGYSFFLSGLAGLSESQTWFKIVQIVLGTVSCGLIPRLTWRVFGSSRAALVSAMMAALYGPLVYYDIQISPATLDTFLFLLLLVLLLEIPYRPHVYPWLVVVGCVAAASALTRGGVLLLMPFAFIRIWRLPVAVGTLNCRAARAARCIAVAMPLVITISAVAGHNYRYDVDAMAIDPGEPRSVALVSTNLGINFLLGNQADMYALNDVDHPLCFVQYKMEMEEPRRRGIGSASGSSRYLFDKAAVWIAQNPAAWAALMGRKVLELLSGEEISRDTSLYASRLENPLMAGLFWVPGIALPSGVLLPFALAGVVWALLRRRGSLIVWASLGTQAVFVLAFFVTTRYRLPLCAMLIPFAAQACVRITTAVASRNPWRSIAWLGLVCALMVLCNQNSGELPRSHRPFEYVHLANVMAARGDFETALTQLQNALDLDPWNAPAHFLMAEHFAGVGKVGLALEHYAHGLRSAPEAYTAREAYASLLARLGRDADAVSELQVVSSQAPTASNRQLICELAARSNIKISGTCR